MYRFAALACALVSCARVVPPAPPPSPPPARPAPAPAVPPAKRLAIEITTDATSDNRVIVDLSFEGPLAAVTDLAFRPAHAVTLADIAARDDDGPIAVDTSLHLARAGHGKLHVHYALTFGAAEDALAPIAEPVALQAAGEDLLALPAGDERMPVELKLRTGGSAFGGASSFALGSDQRFEARANELHNAYYLAGDVGTATFHASDGDDFTAWLGHTAFDPRWIGAEAAATRSAVDAYVGATPGTSPLSLLVVSAKRDYPPVVLAPRTRGLLASADRRATWTATSRLLVGQALTRRYVGGFLWVGAREPSTEKEGWFFSEGFSRAIARDVLFDHGMIEPGDRATEMNALLAAIAFAPDERTVATAQGALLATALDVAARKKQSSLRVFLRERLADAATKKADTIALADFIARARATAGDAFADVMTATLARGAEVPLPSDLLGRCWRLERRPLVPFELGIVTTAGEEVVVQSVTSRSRAEAAGVRNGDVVVTIDYRNGQSATPVKLTLQRGNQRLNLHYLPAGTTKPGRIYERVAGIPDERCSL